MSGRAVKSGEKYLVPSIHPETERYAFESQVRECYGRCAYTHKTHERMADGRARNLHRVKWAQIVLSAFTTAGAIGVIFDKNSTFFPYATVTLSVLMLVLNSYVKDLDPGQAAQKHREAASDIWNVREAYLSLLTDIHDPSFTLGDLRKRRDELQAQLAKIYHSAPHTNGKAYAEAQDALKNREDLTFSDAEIDAFLPGPLKRLPSRAAEQR
jgi:SMODS and SLOG-associating 2TM effector domain family 4